jgi:predicted RNase H-like nuclease (RuvC/YqgF family)
MLNKVNNELVKAGKTVTEVVKDCNFQKGVIVGLLPTGIIALLCKKYKKQAEEKEELYKKALAEHNAVINELKTESQGNKGMQERLLAYDTKLKNEMKGYQSQIQELNDKIAELEKKKAKDEQV